MHIACMVLPQFGILCERARRLQLHSEPIGLSEADAIQVVSDEARERGIKPGQSVSGAKAILPRLFVLEYDRPIYEEAAARIWDLLAIESSIVEPESPERAYVELDGRDITQRLQSLTNQISESIDTPVLVGLARTKLLAWQAALTGERGKVVLVEESAEKPLLAPVRLDSLPQIDPKTRQRLDKLSIRTLSDLRRISFAELKRQFPAAGLQLSRLACGEDNDPVRPLWPPPSIEERYCFDAFEGFVETSVDQRTIEHALRCCAEGIAEQLQRQRTFCRSLSLTLACTDGDCLHQSERLDSALNDSKAVYTAAQRLLGRMRMNQPPIELTVQAGEIATGSGVQLALMDERGVDRERARQLEAKLSELRDQFGIGAVTRGVVEEPRRITLYTFTLTHRFFQPVDVRVDEHGLPLTVSRVGRRGGVYDQSVTSICDVWKETKWFWGDPYTWTIYRVELEAGTLYDLHHLAHDEWRMGGVGD